MAGVVDDVSGVRSVTRRTPFAALRAAERRRMERGDEERAALATPKSKPRRVARLARSFPPLTSIPFTAPFVNSRFFPPDDVT